MKTLWKIIISHIQYRKQILQLAKTDMIKTYRGALLSWGWAILKPAITIAVYYFAFTGPAHRKSGKGIPILPVAYFRIYPLVLYFRYIYRGGLFPS